MEGHTPTKSGQLRSPSHSYVHSSHSPHSPHASQTQTIKQRILKCKSYSN